MQLLQDLTKVVYHVLFRPFTYRYVPSRFLAILTHFVRATLVFCYHLLSFLNSRVTHDQRRVARPALRIENCLPTDRSEFPFIIFGEGCHLGKPRLEEPFSGHFIVRPNPRRSLVL